MNNKFLFFIISFSILGLFSDQNVVWAMNIQPVFDQKAFRWRNDDGTQGAATWKAAENANITGQAKNDNVRLRTQTAQTAAQDQGVSVTPLLEYKAASGGACTDSSGWTTITTSTTNAFALIDSIHFTDLAAAFPNLLAAIGGSTYSSGEMLDQTNPASARLAGAGKYYTEHEWNFAPTSNASALTAYIFRLSNGTNNTNLNVYTVCPQLTTAADAPTISTVAAGSIDYDSATLNGSIDITGGENATQHGFAYGTDSALSTVIATTTLGAYSGTGTFNETINSFDPSTTYYFRAYATNGGGTGYGSILNFTTDAPPAAPTVTTNAATDITINSATLNGNLDSGTASEHGFAYGIDSTLSTVIATTTLGSKGTTGAFSDAISSLDSGTVYYFRAYATNVGGTGLGSILNFTTTNAAPTAPSLAAPVGGGGAWALAGSGFSVTNATEPALAGLSSTRVAFIDSTNDSLRAYDFNGSTWSLTGNGLSVATGNNSAIDGMSSSRIVFTDAGSNELRAYDFDGTDWSLTGSGFNLTSIGAPAVAGLSSTRAAFVDGANDQLRTYDFNGSTWSQTGNSFSLVNANPALAALSSTRVAYVDGSNDELRAYDFNGTDWSLVGSGLAISTITIPSLAALSSTQVAFVDDGNDSLRTYEFDGSTWSLVSGTSLALTAFTGRTGLTDMTSSQVAFVDGTNDELRAYSSASTATSTTPTFNMTSTDPESDAITYEVNIYTSADCSGTALQTHDQSVSTTGWSASNYSSGTQGQFVLPSGSALSSNTTYTWRARAKDPSGSNSFSSYSSCATFLTENSTVSVTLDVSNFAYGSMANNTASSTLTLFGGLGITATNDSGSIENFDIYGANTVNWTLAGTTGSNQYIHQFCNDTDNDCSGPPTNYVALTTSPQTLKNSVANTGTVDFQLRVTTPNPSTVYTEQSAVVTVQASAP